MALPLPLAQQRVQDAGCAGPDEPLDVANLLDRLKDAAKAGFDERIYLRGARSVNYGRVAEVMSLVTSAGYKKIALVTEQGKK